MDRHDSRSPRRRTRRELLKMAPLSAVVALANPAWRDNVLRSGLEAAEAVATAVFRPGHLAPIYAAGAVTPFERFPLNSYLVHDPHVDLDAWRLKVSGLVARPSGYHLGDFASLGRVAQNTRHICIEGWDVIGAFGGVRLTDVLDLVGTDPSARFLEIACADDYYESIDIASARHPQSLLCDEMYGRPLTREHGAPLRLVMPIKLGYKQAKYIVGLRLTRTLGARRGYWEDQGYPWFGGV